MTRITAALLVGSSRRQSLNRRLARAIETLAPDTISFRWIEMDRLPFYNGDLEDDRPAEVRAFTEAVAAVDAICIVTPEYNRSIPAVLKNAIDWGSKPPAANVWRDKVIAVTGTSPGAIGTAVAQAHLREILPILGAHVVPGEAYISFRTPDLIDEDGTITDPSTHDFIAAFAARLADLAVRLKG